MWNDNAEGGDRPRLGEGLVVVVSGPSGSGKSTLVKRLLAEKAFPLVFSISATSRPPRDGEVNGVDYWFLTRDEFQAKIDRNELLEYASVHDNLYGTLRIPVEEAIRDGNWVLLEVDVQGYQQVKKIRPDAVGFFVRAASVEDYRQRLENRGTERPDDIERRFESVRRELREAINYDFQIINEDVEQAFHTWCTLLQGVMFARGMKNV